MTAKELADAVIAAVKRALAPLSTRLDQVEQTLANLPTPEKGEKGDPGAGGAPGERGADGAPGVQGERGEKGDPGETGARGEKGETGESGRVGERGEKGERGDVGEPGRDGRDGAPGAIGERGKNGRDGVDGKDGKDALGFDDLTLDYDGERSVVFRFQQGERTKEFSVRMPILIDRGVFRDTDAYERGDAVSFGGSLWIAQKDAPAGKPGLSDDWRLAVKKGRDAKQPVKLS